MRTEVRAQPTQSPTVERGASPARQTPVTQLLAPSLTRCFSALRASNSSPKGVPTTRQSEFHVVDHNPNSVAWNEGDSHRRWRPPMRALLMTGCQHTQAQKAEKRARQWPNKDHRRLREIKRRQHKDVATAPDPTRCNSPLPRAPIPKLWFDPRKMTEEIGHHAVVEHTGLGPRKLQQSHTAGSRINTVPLVVAVSPTPGQRPPSAHRLSRCIAAGPGCVTFGTVETGHQLVSSARHSKRNYPA